MNPKYDTPQFIRKLTLCVVILVGLIMVFTVVNQASAIGGGNALDFDGTGDYVTAGFDPVILGQSFTIETWVHPRSDGNYHGIAGNYDNPPSGIKFGQYETDGWVFFAGLDGTSWTPEVKIQTIPLDEWSHVAAVYVGGANGSLEVYFNGELVGSTTYNGSISHRNPFYIGRAYNGGDSYLFDGLIDDFRVWNDVRTAAEIRANMYADLTGGEPDLVAAYNFNQGAAGNSNPGVDELIDATGNYTGTLHNFALTGTTSNWVADGGYGIIENTDGDHTGIITRDPDQMLFPAGSTVTMTAAADAGSSFDGWSGDLIGTANPDTLTLEAHKEITATFTWDSSPGSTWTNHRPANLELGRGRLNQGGNALNFDGTMDATGDYVTTSIDPSASLGQEFTLEAWINPHSAGDYRGVAGDHLAGEGIVFGQYTVGWGGWAFAAYDGSAELPQAAVPALPLDQWSHIAAVYVGNAAGPGSITVYVNGEQAAQSTWNNKAISHLTSFYIGRAFAADNRYFDGGIDEFRVWTTARSAAEIQATMHASLTGNETDLLAYYDFNQGTAGGDNTGLTTLADRTANNYDGTLHNFDLTGYSSNWLSGWELEIELSGPRSVAVDPITGKVFVADRNHHRVLRYASTTALRTGAAPEGVLGQVNFSSTDANRNPTPPHEAGIGAHTLFAPHGLAVDRAGRLWVADYGNHRILRFDNAATKANGADADGVLGRPDFTTWDFGTTAAEFRDPTDVFVDTDGRLWVADHINHRILRFDDAAAKTNGAAADGVLGQSDFTSRAEATTQNGMIHPTGVVVSADGTLWVADRDNHRILRFDSAADKVNGSAADGVLGQENFTSGDANRGGSAGANTINDPNGLALDPEGRLFVSEWSNNRVLIYEAAAAKADGAAADHVLGQPDFTTTTTNTGGRSASSLSGPVFLAFDPVLSALWVAEENNNRALAYGYGVTVNQAGTGTGTINRTPNQQLFESGDTVTLTADPDPASTFTGWSGSGCTGTGDCILTMDDPKTVTATFTWDGGTSWDAVRPANLVLGQADFTTGVIGTSQNGFKQPYAVTVDPTTGKVFVSDTYNHRVLRYASATALLNGAPAEGVLGQANFNGGTHNRDGVGAKANSFHIPLGVHVDRTGRLWVADYGNHRVVYFDNAAEKWNGAAADGILGQPNFTSSTANNGGRSAATLFNPYSPWVDTRDNLWVVDHSNHRILRWADAANITNQQPADGVLGQSEFNLGDQTPAAANSLNYPLGLVMSADGTLYVSEQGNNRVLRFDNAAEKPNGADADGVLGQLSFTATTADDVSQSGVPNPTGLALDPGGRLFVANYSAHRITVFEDAANKSGTLGAVNADYVLGQPDFDTGTENTGGRSALSLKKPVMIFYDPALAALWVADEGNHRVLAYGFGVTEGIRRTALDFDGTMDATGDYVTAGFTPTSSLGQAFTIEAWVNPHSAANHRGIAGNYDNPFSGINFGQYDTSNGGWVFQVGLGSSWSPSVAIPSLPLHQWNHVAAVYVGGGLRQPDGLP